MALLQPKLNLKVAQRQILTPGLMQMVSVLALNRIELKEMIQSEICENPVLEEMEENVPLIDDVAQREEDHDRSHEAKSDEPEQKDPFDEIDFGSYFQEYLDPGFRTPNSFEITEKPSIENFLSAPSTLSDYLLWQLGSLTISTAIRDAAEYLIGNLNEDGYLTVPEDELLAGYLREQLVPEADSDAVSGGRTAAQLASLPPAMVERARAHLAAGLEVVHQLDPLGIAWPDLRTCLLAQVNAQRHEFDMIYGRRRGSHPRDLEPHEAPLDLAASAEHNGHRAAPAALVQPSMPEADEEDSTQARMAVFETATAILERHMLLLQKRDPRELSKAVGRSVDETQRAIDFIRTLDPRPGQRYNRSEARLIEPDVAFVKRDDEFVVVMNDEDLPTLRLNHGYRRLLHKDGAEKEVRDYVKERYRSALQLMRNIEQRKNTILRTCEAIVRRQTDFLEHGIESMKPMMIKEVAEEIGVHPSTVSRAVSNKYVHTPQGVFELRFFFSEGVNGPEGSGLPLVLLKRKVKKLIEEEDPAKPLTDDQIAQLLETQGIQVTRRTVAKYREDMQIPSTHQRRVRT
jgi:RNA polymerase sigma-54 factor